MPLRVTKLSKQIGNEWILRDFSFESHRGEIFGLLGDKFSTASITARIIAGREKSFRGEVLLDETKISTENVSYLGRPEVASRKIFSWQKDAGINVNSLQQLENAIEETNSILVLDDIFSNLDLASREQAFALMRKAAVIKNLSVIVTSNRSNDFFASCDRLGIYENGEIVQVGTPREIYENPTRVSVARALGRNNLFVARRVTFNNQDAQEFVTIVGEHRIHTAIADKKSLGAITQNVTLAIRPEHLSISFGASFPDDNLIKAKISAVHYQGATTRVVLDSNGLILEALVLRLVGLELGDECMVGLPPDRILVLKT